MRKVERPFAYFHNFSSIPFSFYEEQGIKVILSDLDNTLAPYDQKLPDESMIALIKEYKDKGFRFYIASNNTGKRVKLFAKSLGVPYLSWLMKPWGFRLKKALRKLKINPSEACLIGDQIATDVKAGNRAGVKTVYLDPLVKRDPIWTVFNRKFEKKMRDEIKNMENIKGVLKYE